MSELPQVEVTDASARKRFEAHVGGELVGIVDYIPLPGKVIATHTEVFDGYEGKGVGGQLVGGMIAQLRADGRLLQPLYPYVTAYLRRHPEQADVVDRSAPH